MKARLGINNRTAWFVLLGAFLAIFTLFAAADGIQEWLWMKQVGYGAVFWRILAIRFAAAFLALLAAGAFLWVNLRLAVKTIFRLRGNVQDSRAVIHLDRGLALSTRWARAGALLVAAAVGLFFAAMFYAQWDTYLRFHWAGDFGRVDPIFGRDIGFYLFRLPFYELLRNAAMGLSFMALVVTGLAYSYFQLFHPRQVRSAPTDRMVAGHLALLLLLLVACWGWGFYLDRFGLLYSTRGVVYGVGYTADHIERLGLWIMLLAAALLGLFIVLCLRRRRLYPMLIGVGSFFGLYLLVLVLLPGLVQKYKVEPSELELETPYLKHNIDFTRQAFQLDKIVEKAYPALGELSLADIDKHRTTIENIRLWDWRPILQTYRQTQEIRLYYEFYAVDVDRYHMADGYHQVMLAARELAAQLPPKARTWINERLQFTHGYGLVMSFVSTQTEGGLPAYALQDIPPTSAYQLDVAQPAVYYGEKTPGYRIVDTEVKEFDYPKGSDNVYTRYAGQGGIPLDNVWKKLLFAWTQSDVNILLSSYLTPESRIQIHRNVQERVDRIAPFLSLDRDPYLVLAGGRLYWIQDAYTISNRFPYAQPSGTTPGGLNYIRNSVKVVVDVYEGRVTFYVMDPVDPVLAVYRRAFPGMFHPLAELAPELKAHLRYPEDLFAIQAGIYMNYHMTDPQVFYNQEDLWALPQEKYAGQAVPFQPYYILMRLPDTDAIQYFLMTPFTPQGRDNMISWMGANCDFPDYGQIILYQLPKERLTFGPLQIEAMIDQNAVISEQLSLWDQRGSQVIRGNLVVIPIENSFLYVEPVYLLAEGLNIPQLIRVIVISGRKVVMEPTLAQAIQAVFGNAPPAAAKTVVPNAREAEIVQRAREALDRAQEALRGNQWNAFGRAMEDLTQALKPAGADAPNERQPPPN
jgi:uncharacterized membrane protein (UPF0182 family)